MKFHRTENDQFLHHVRVDTEAKLFPFSTHPSLDAAVSSSEKAPEKDGSFLKSGLTFNSCYYATTEVNGLSGLVACFSVPHKVNFSAVR
jgi:hypothetical protein